MPQDFTTTQSVIPQGDVPPATVTVGTFSFDNNAQYQLPTGSAGSASIFTDYKTHSYYEKDNHVYMLGVNSPGGFAGNSVAFVQLSAPTLLWVVRWTAARLVEQPTVPATTTLDPNWVLLDQHLEPADVGVMPDGVTAIYRLTGTYVYGHLNPNASLAANVNFPRPPWLQDNFDRTLPGQYFEGNLMDGGGTGGSSSSTGIDNTFISNSSNTGEQNLNIQIIQGAEG
jgi:hypothetical protein